MGLQNEDAGWLCFDIETVALPDAVAFFEPVEPPANYKKQEAIDAYLDAARARQTEKAGLAIDLAQIVAVSYLSPDWPDVLGFTVNDLSEPEMLREFWQHVRSGTRLIGFNIRHFDLPMLIRRSQYLGVVYPRDLDLTDRRSRRIVDLLEVLSFGNIEHRRSLSFYSKRFGIDSDDTTTGKDIAALVAAQNWLGVEQHCTADVEKTVALARRLGLIGAPVAPEVF